MKYLLFALLLIFSLGQLGRFEFQGLTIHLNDLMTFVVVASWFITKRKNITTDPLFKPLCFWAAAMAISLVLNPIPDAALYAFRFLIYAGLYFVIRDNLKERKTLEKLMNLAVLLVAVIGLGQFILLPDVSFLKAFEWDDHYYRAVSTFLDPGFTGAVLVLGLIPSIVEGSYGRSVLIYIALALTYSRASYLMLLTSSALISKKLFVLSAVALLITIPLLPKSTGEGTKLARENSITARINNWHQTLEVWEKQPIFGIGFNNYKAVSNTNPKSHSGGADSSLLLVLATTGIVGFAAYIYLLKKTWDLGDFVFKASLAGVIIHSFFNNTLFYPWVMEWLWILLALKSKARTLS